MVETAKEQSDNVPETRKRKRRADANGVKCPKNTFLCDSREGPCWYAKITVGGKQLERKSPILERCPGSREAIQAWVIEERNRLEATHFAEHPPLPPKPLIKFESELTYELPLVISQSSIGAVTRLELDYQREEHTGSPNVATVELHLLRISEFFGLETETTSLTMNDTDAYLNFRQTQTLPNGQPPTFETIYRELASFTRAIKAANALHVFKRDGIPFKYELPINHKLRKSRKKRHVVNEKQRSKQFSYLQCQAWIEAAKGTPLEHYTYIAYYTGMRSYELQALKWSWVYRTIDGVGYAELRLPKELYVKSDLDDRPIILNATVYEYIKNLAEGKPKSEPILGKNLPNISEWTRKIARRVEHMLDDERKPIYITLRSLRASYGRLIYRMTKNIRTTQIAMRHRNIQTTIDKYVRVSQADLAEIASALDAVSQAD